MTRVIRFDRHGAITDVAGVRVGHFTDTRRPTGCTVVIPPPGTVGGVDVRGAAPGTRDTELLSPINTVQDVHAVLLSGGSAFGLDAAGGVMRWLESQGIGLQVGKARVPIVPSAILFDLYAGDLSIRPDAQSGHAACVAATSTRPAEGNVGAGAGAAVGKLFGFDRAMKGGVGTASVQVAGVTVGAIVAVNAVGDVIDPDTQCVVAGARTDDGRSRIDAVAAMLRGDVPRQMSVGGATTLAVVATDAVLTKVQANKLAQMAHDGYARAIRPVHTASDGDTIFALATGGSGIAPHPTLLATMACDAVERAIVRAVRMASSVRYADGTYLPCADELDSAASAA